MNSDMKQVDKYFKDKLHQHESAVPADMWDRIAPALEEKSDKVRPIFWLLSSAGLIMVAGLLALLLSGEQVDNEAGIIEAEAMPISQGLTQHIDTDQIAATEETATQSENVEAVFNNDLASIDEVRNILSETASNSIQKEAATTNAKPAPTPGTTHNASVPSFVNHNASPQLTNTEQGNREFKLVITESHFAGKEKISNENTKITISKETKRYLLGIKGLELPTAKVENTDNPIGGIKLFGSKAPQCPSFIDERVGFFIDGYLSHDYAMKSYSGNQSYSNLRQQTESSLYSYGAGVRFSYFLGKGWGVRSGLNYSQVNERFAYDDPNSKTTKTILEVEVNEVGDTISVSQKIVEVEGRHTITHSNKYHFIDIPILLFYEFSLGDSPFYFSANAGTYVNLMFEQSGRYLSPEGNPVEIAGDDEYPNQYNNTAGVSLYASFGVHYILNKNIDLILEPHVMTQVNSITRSDSDLEERFTSFGLNTGIRYKF